MADWAQHGTANGSALSTRNRKSDWKATQQQHQGRRPRSPTDSARVLSRLHPLTRTLSLLLAWGYGFGSGMSSGIGRKLRNGLYMKKWTTLVNVARMPGAKHTFTIVLLKAVISMGVPVLLGQNGAVGMNTQALVYSSVWMHNVHTDTRFLVVSDESLQAMAPSSTQLSHTRAWCLQQLHTEEMGSLVASITLGLDLEHKISLVHFTVPEERGILRK